MASKEGNFIVIEKKESSMDRFKESLRRTRKEMEAEGLSKDIIDLRIKKMIEVIERYYPGQKVEI